MVVESFLLFFYSTEIPKYEIRPRVSGMVFEDKNDGYTITYTLDLKLEFNV